MVLLLPHILLLTCSLGLAKAAITSGCGKQATNVGLTTPFNVTSSNASRNFLVHVPLGYDNHHQYPVVLAFHGNTETAAELELDTRLSDPKWSPSASLPSLPCLGFKLMVYPNGINASWAGASYSNSTISQDLQFVSDVLSDLSSNFCIDSNKIYATGFSNGGGFVDILACSGNSVGAKFAAFVAASGAYYQEALYNSTYQCVPAKSPTPIAFIHGLNDSDVFYDGGDGEGGFLPAVPAVVDSWVSRNRCGNLSTADSYNGTVHISSWTCDGVDGALEHYREADMGHVWASQQQTFSQLVIGEGPTKLEANDVIMKFFDKFSLDKESNWGRFTINWNGGDRH
ncbi:alpha/beta-hydrolase [Coniochaeta ligniaria NRRL 30616]|uniref:feruloyl esterase n=1 Tax=Coniochaeta ligniaria NRRL 30616 TaxID=1408157 RepID=A0A1J7I5B5_9PEZI|nr:alpha/beta-hydrolase [Coniochaeta ligniaria NRRL 30616]